MTTLWQHIDRDGDRLVVGLVDRYGPDAGVCLLTDPDGHVVPVGDIPALIAALTDAAAAAIEEPTL